MTKYGLEVAHSSGEREETVVADGFDLTETGDLYFWKTSGETGRKELVIIYNARRWLTIYEIEED